MEYSKYSLEQIMSNKYKELCNIFFDLAQNDDIKRTLNAILYEGGLDGYSFSSRISSKDSPYIESQRRISMAYLLIRNPETFYELSRSNVNVFHGTNANALSNILKYGVTSIDESSKLGVEVTTGEEWSRVNGGRDFVSFTDVLDIAEGYSTFGSTVNDESLSFGVVIGTTVEDVMQAGVCRVSSDVPEIGIKSCLPKESIKVICVPTDKIEFVKRIVDSNIKVLAMDDVDKKFYYADDLGLEIYYGILEEFKNGILNKSDKKEFKNEEVEELAKSRGISKVKEVLEKIKSLLGKSKEVSYDTKGI